MPPYGPAASPPSPPRLRPMLPSAPPTTPLQSLHRSESIMRLVFGKVCALAHHQQRHRTYRPRPAGVRGAACYHPGCAAANLTLPPNGAVPFLAHLPAQYVFLSEYTSTFLLSGISPPLVVTCLEQGPNLLIDPRHASIGWAAPHEHILATRRLQHLIAEQHPPRPWRKAVLRHAT